MVAVTVSTFETGLADSGAMKYGPGPGGAGPLNTIQFTIAYNSRISGNPVYDEANRMIKYTEYTFSINGTVAFIGVGDDNGPTMELLRESLERPGGRLEYSNKGFGGFNNNAKTFVVNDNGVFDVAWGPQPKVLSFVPIGNMMAANVVWECVVRIPESTNPIYKNKLMAFNYDVDWSINKDGYHVVKYAGFIEIPLTFSGRTLIDNADKYREKCVPAQDARFQREQSYRLSKDRRRLDFNVTDTQKPVALPTGTTVCDVKHRVRGHGATTQAMIRWECTINGTIRILPNFPRLDAYRKFFTIVNDRIGWARTQIIPQIVDIGLTPTQVRGTPTVLITDVEYEEDVFGVDDRFSVKYVILQCDITNILNVSGMWKTPPTGTFSDWRRANASMAGDPRGNIKLMFNPGADVIIDLTAPDPQLPRLNPSGPLVT